MPTQLALNAENISLGVTPQEIIDIALANIGEPWAADGCAAFVWGVTNLAGLPFFDLENKTVNNDPRSPQDSEYIVPHSAGIGSGRADVSGDGWYLVSSSSSVADLVSMLQPGDVVRVYKDASEGFIDASGNAIAHSFIVVSNVGGNIQVVDNWNGAISEHALSDITNIWAPQGQFAAAFVSRIDSAWVEANVPQNTLVGDAFGDWSALSHPMTTIDKVGSEILVSTDGDNGYAYPTVCELTNGDFVIAWPSLGSIKAQLFDPSGTEVGSEFLIDTYSLEWTYVAPTITGLSNGGFVVTWWAPDANPANPASVRVEVFDASGAKVVTGSVVSVNAPSNFWGVTELTNGDFVLTWMQFDGIGSNVNAQLFDASGAKVGSPILVSGSANAASPLPSVTELTNGGFVVAWVNTSGSNINAQMFDGGGAKVGSEFLVRTETSNFPGNLSITGLTDGGFAVTWFDGGLGSLMVRAFDASGAKVGESQTTGVQTFGDSKVAALTNGGFVVTWGDTSGTLGDSGGAAVAAQVFDATGAQVSSEFLVNTTTGGGQFEPSITGLTNGGFVVTWFDFLRGVKAQVFTLELPTQPPIISSVSAAPSDGDLGPGNTITLTVNFSEAVTVAGGTPTLALNDGGTAFYTSGSGSSALVFTYTVGAVGSGQTTSDLALAATDAFNLNGATITDAFGTAADLSGANGYNPVGTLEIDTTPPTLIDNAIIYNSDIPIATAPQIAVEMIKLAVDAYPDSSSPGYHTYNLLTPPGGIPPDSSARVDINQDHWHAVSASELGINDLGQDGLFKYSFADGYYQAIQVDPFTGLPADTVSSDPSEADALVLTGVINDKKTLAISFAGTDQLSDWNDFANFGTHYAKFAPLVSAIKDFIDANHIDQVFVSGHSLGAAMVQDFMGDFPGDPRFQAWTIGSPGSDNVASATGSDSKIVNYIHTGDPVTQVPLLSGVPADVKDAFVPTVATFIIDLGNLGLSDLQEAYSLAWKVVHGQEKFRGADIGVGGLLSTHHDRFLYEYDVNAHYGFPFQLKLIDGYIAGATVFADANGNGKLDLGELSTTTDANGHFAPIGSAVPLVAFGGTDISTGLAFKGQLEAPAGSTAITPLTTVVSSLQKLGTSNTEAQLLSATGLDPSLDLTTFDPIAAMQANNPNAAKVYAVGAGVMNTVTMIASALTSTGPIASNTVQVFATLANLIGAQQGAIDLTDACFVSSAHHRLRAIVKSAR